MLMLTLVMLHIFAILFALAIIFAIYWRVLELLQSITRHVV